MTDQCSLSSSSSTHASISAGIGGASFSYFLNNHFNATRSPGVTVRVTVHERTAVVGGRLRELKGFGNTKVIDRNCLPSTNLTNCLPSTN